MTNRRHLPSVDRVLKDPEVAKLSETYGLLTIKRKVQGLQKQWRSADEIPDVAIDVGAYSALLNQSLDLPGYRTVYNLTGTILHTNLGRALLSETQVSEIERVVTRPVALEYDIDEGGRGDRDAPVTRRLKALTGAEAATVVNNNAAAVLLCLNTLANNKQVPVSRGEMVEIGGSFRIPEIIESAGCELVEVGTTNRTHLKDYQKAISANTGLLLKVHPSNYKVSGFTHEVALADLVTLGQENGVAVCVDLGSGSLVNFKQYGLPFETTVQQTITQGADLVTFSGDKLLGTVQCGVIVGKKKFIDQLKENPLKRALRADKITLALLELTLREYENPENLTERLPLLKTLTTPLNLLQERAEKITTCLSQRLPNCTVKSVPSECQLGSGSLPGENVVSVAVRISAANDHTIRQISEAFRQLPTPVIGRIHDGALWLDMRGADRDGELCENFSNLSIAL